MAIKAQKGTKDVLPEEYTQWKSILAKADEIFAVLKANKWEKKNKLFMFYEDAPLKQFNQLYTEMLALNAQMDEIRQKNRSELKQKL